ncbi:ATP-binding protein [Haematomicrobium sanguinis]|uniref:ATP-binding protein n=1 Tax=Haematomicrobium sanguinis TaxID=479106 RepID=UPI0012FC3D40|nr:ATP-binding protein [Haematomicrobium sanguinis]
MATVVMAVAVLEGTDPASLLERARQLARTGLRADEPVTMHIIRVQPRRDRGPEMAKRAVDTAIAETGLPVHRISEGDDAARTVVEAANDLGANVLVVPDLQTRWWERLRSTGFTPTVVRQAAAIPGMSVLVAPQASPVVAPAPLRWGSMPRARMLIGFVLALALPLFLQFVVFGPKLEPQSIDLMVYLTAVVLVAIIGGLWPALVAAVVSALMVNLYSTQPIGSFHVNYPPSLLALVLYLVVALAVSLVVGLSSKRNKMASLKGAQAAALSEVARGLITLDHSASTYLERVREYFRASYAALLIKADGDGVWQRLADSNGAQPDTGTLAALGLGEVEDDAEGHVESRADGHGEETGDAVSVEPLDDGMIVAVRGRRLAPEDLGMLRAFGAYLVALYQREKLQQASQENVRLQEGNSMRTAILQAVSHDLRTPLTAIKLSASALQQPGVTFDKEDERQLLGTIEESSDRLNALVENLLDMSRIAGDTVAPLTQSVSWNDVMARALRGIDVTHLRPELPDNLPLIDADPGMLERVIANVLENAIKYGGDNVRVTALASDQGQPGTDSHPMGSIRIIDRGPGITEVQRQRLFDAFQRFNDDSSTQGIGLGLAVARGFALAMRGSVRAENTPGGGLTMIISMPLSTGHGSPASRGDRAGHRAERPTGHRTGQEDRP